MPAALFGGVSVSLAQSLTSSMPLGKSHTLSELQLLLCNWGVQFLLRVQFLLLGCGPDLVTTCLTLTQLNKSKHR